MKRLLFVKSQSAYIKGFFYRTLVESLTEATNYGIFAEVAKRFFAKEYPDVEIKKVIEFTTIRTKWEKILEILKQ